MWNSDTFRDAINELTRNSWFFCVSEWSFDIEKLMKFVNDFECDIDCMSDESNTTTSNGRMVMRIMISVSQNEMEKELNIQYIMKML